MFFSKSRKHKSVLSKYRYHLYCSFDKPPLVEGPARILDLGGTLRCNYWLSRNPYEKDIAATRNDWRTIGQDIDEAIGAYPNHGTTERLTHE